MPEDRNGMKYRLQDLIDIAQFQALQDRLNEIYSFPSSIIDNEGTILTATAWQDLCTKYHRQNKEGEKECIRSDQYIVSHLAEANPAVSYRCPHGLIDNATPIIIDGEHLGNFFTGQFFLERPDLEFFKKQAVKYGFDEEAYLEAVRKVPIWTKEQLNSYLFFIKGLIEVIGSIGLKNLRAIDSEQRARESEERLRLAMMGTNDGLWDWNLQTDEVYYSPRWKSMLGYTPDELEHTIETWKRLVHPDDRERVLTAVRSHLEGRTDRYEVEFRMRHKDGHYLNILSRAFLTNRADGTVLRLVGTHVDMTERKNIEQQLRKSEERYRLLVETANSVILTWDTTGNILFVNEYCERFFGFSKDELLGRSVIGTIVPATESSGRDLVQLMQEIQRDPDRFRDNENENITKDGRRVWIRWANKAIVDRDGKLSGILSVGNDITERKKAELRLAHMHELMRYVISHAQTAIAVHDRDMRYIYVSEQYLRQYKVQEKDVIGKHHYDVFPDLPQKWRDVHKRVLAGAVEGKDEDPYVSQDGSVDWTRWECRPWYENDGSIGGLIVYTEVITERVHREKALRSSEERLRLAVHGGSVGIWEWDIATNNLDWNDQLKAIFGLPPDVIGLTLQRFLSAIHPEDLKDTEDAFRKALNEKAEFKREYRIILPDSSVRWIEAIGRGIYGPEGQPLRMLGCALDITERKKAEEQLRESEGKYRAIVENTNEWIWSCDMHGIHTYSNNAVLDILGYTPEEFIRRSAIDMVHPDDIAEISRCVQQAVSSRSGWSKRLFRWQHKDGSYRTLESSATPMFGADGSLRGWYGVDRDITERHLLEEERLKTQKLESIGTLAGGIAHDFNNLLQGVFGYISMAKLTADNKDKMLAMLAHAEGALHQSVNLTTQLLTFSKGGKPAKKLLDLRAVIENSVKFTLSGSRSDFRLDIEPDLWQVEADEGQITQVIQNIVLNADQSMPMGGSVLITATNISKQSGLLPQSLAVGNYVRIAIRDSGIGIPEQYISKIFDPYFTTKEKGSGLGLATSYSIIRNHDGLIDVISTAGKGTTFFIYLPAVKAEIGVRAAPEVSGTGRKGKILVMDDDELIRNIAGELIRAMDHDLVLAEHGEAAIDKYRAAMESGSPFDAVILDLTIRGGMGGRETIRRLREIDPAVRAVVSSGYSDDAVIADYKHYGFTSRLTKPYTLEVLRDTLNSLLNS
jgi:two-component system, cell cycle sensor histidine kinase and response regulator CckA